MARILISVTVSAASLLLLYIVCSKYVELYQVTHPEGLPHRPRQLSWDQETLKRSDHGCPTAIYTVVDGELVQCAP
jgi:hypothetical protein